MMKHGHGINWVEPAWKDGSMKLAAGNRIESVLADIKSAGCYDEVNAVMKKIGKDFDNIAVVGGHRLELGGMSNLQRELNGLIKVQHLHLTSAPRVVELIQIKGDCHGVLVTRIDGTNHAQLHGNVFGAGKPLTTAEVKAGLREDVEKLQSAGLWNDAFERFNCWYLQPETKRVIVNPWFPVAVAVQQTLQEGRERVMGMIEDA